MKERTNTRQLTAPQKERVEKYLKDLLLITEIIHDCPRCAAKFAELRRLH